MKKKLFVLSGLALSVMPSLAFAASGCTTYAKPGTIQSILCKIGDLLNIVIPVVIALGIVYFVWGIISYVIAGDEEAKTKGRDRMIYGIIGLAVIVAMWGLVNILLTTFGVKAEDVTLPTL